MDWRRMLVWAGILTLCALMWLGLIFVAWVFLRGGA